MDYRTETFPLNHFVLWSKGWYSKVHETGDINKDLEDTMKGIFTLDDYVGVIMKSIDFVGILLSTFEDYNDWVRKNGWSYWRLVDIINEMRTYQWLGYNENNAIIMAIRSYFKCRPISEIRLSKPVYSRELYKKYDLIIKGQIFGTPKHGMTYKEMNNEVSKYKW